jgi:hypothetical protein
VIGGMLSATFVATFLIPMFFVVIGKYMSGTSSRRQEARPEGLRPVTP